MVLLCLFSYFEQVIASLSCFFYQICTVFFFLEDIEVTQLVLIKHFVDIKYYKRACSQLDVTLDSTS